MIVYLDDKRRQFAQLVNKIQHAVGGVPLLLIGLGKLREGEEIPIALAEVAIAAIVLGTFLVELRAAVRHAKYGVHAHPKIGWFDLAAGALLIYEAFHGAHLKPGYLRPQFFTGLVTIALGVLHHRIADAQKKRRYFKIDDDEVEFRKKFRGWRIPLAEVAGIEVGGKQAVFTRKDGRRHKVHLGRLHNHAEVRRAITGHPGAAKLLGPR